MQENAIEELALQISNHVAEGGWISATWPLHFPEAKGLTAEQCVQARERAADIYADRFPHMQFLEADAQANFQRHADSYKTWYTDDPAAYE